MKVNKQTIITLAFAFLIGLGASYVWYAPEDDPQAATGSMEERITIPEGGIRTAAFPVRLLQAAAEAQPEGNITVAPNSLTALLTRFEELAEGPAKAALGTLKLPKELLQTAVQPYEVALIFPDSQVCKGTELPAGSDIHPAPFCKDGATARTIIGRTLPLYTEGGLDGASACGLLPRSPEPGIVTIHGTALSAAWMYPPEPADMAAGEFTQADGKKQTVSLQKHRGFHRTAEAADGSWKAAALFFRNEEKQGESLCFVVILPKEGTSARDFASKELTPEKLTEIRSALVQAPPAPCTVVIPGIETLATTQDAGPALKAMGLGGLFTEACPFPKLSGKNKAPLTLAAQQHMLLIQDEPAPAGQAALNSDSKAPVRLEANRPFIWYIGDLTTGRPPYLMGITEKM